MQVCSAPRSRQHTLLFFHLSSLIPQSITLVNVFLGHKPVAYHSCRVKVFQLVGRANRLFNCFVTEAQFIERTTASTEELQKSDVLQLSGLYFLQVPAQFLFVLLQLPPHSASSSLQLRILWILDSLGNNGLVSKSQTGRHFQVNGLSIFS